MSGDGMADGFTYESIQEDKDVNGDTDSEDEERMRLDMERQKLLSGEQKRIIKRRDMGKERDVHASLHKALSGEHAAVAEEKKLRIRATSALVGRRAEVLYRQHRPASAAANFVRGLPQDEDEHVPRSVFLESPRVRPPHTHMNTHARKCVRGLPQDEDEHVPTGVFLEFPQSRLKEGATTAEPEPRGMRRTFGVGRSGEILDGKQYCVHSPCRMLHDKEHMDRFMHVCPREDFCVRKHDDEHTRYYTHQQTAEEFERIRDWYAGTGWAAEKKKLAEPRPDREAAIYQRLQPPPATCPRFGYRPQGGSTCRSELRNLKRGAAKETVAVEVTGLHPMWDYLDFATYVRDHCSFKARIVEAKIFMQHGLSIGVGRIVCGCYEDANLIIRSLDGRSRGNVTLSAKYEEPFVLDKANRMVDTTFDSTSKRRPRVDLAVRKYNMGIRSCGAYIEDALALKQRMETEGHTPDHITYTCLLRAMKDHNPPQAARAEHLLRELVAQGIKPTAIQCNLVIEAWTKLGHMKRAEMLAEEMETDSRNREHLALPTEDTYALLAEGWEAAGVMDQIKDRQKLVGEEVSPHSKKVDRISVIGANEPAKKAITLWGRKRGGYLSLHSGVMAPAKDHRQSMWNSLRLQKWRDKL